MSGYVYAFRSVKTGLTKIGYSIDPQQRLVNLQSTYGPLEVIAIKPTPTPPQTEAEIHAALDDYRVIGEWFKVTVSGIRNTLGDGLIELGEAVRGEVPRRAVVTHNDKLLKDIARHMRIEGITQTELAQRIESSRSYISQVMTGEKSRLPKTIEKILDTLGLELVAKPKDAPRKE